MQASFPVVVLALLACSASARADLAPPLENVVCEGKTANDPCEVDGAGGVCVADKCSRLDYSSGVPPTSVSRDCLRCQPGAAPPVEQTPATKPVTRPEPAAVAAPPPPQSTSRCNMGHSTGVAPLLLGLAVLFRRRRR